MKKYMLLFCCCVLFLGCEEFYKFDFINNSAQKIYFYKDYQKSVIKDTLIKGDNKPGLYINPQERSYQGALGTLENLFKRENVDTVSIYFFEAETADNIPWENIKKEYKVLKRYDLSLRDIQLLNYEIPYPPTSVMKDMRMYPPYGGN